MINNNNTIAFLLVLLAVITHYMDFVLGIPSSNSISVGLLAAGTTLINFQVQKEK